MNEVINKKAIVDRVALKTGCTKKTTSELLDAIFEEIANALKDGDSVDISRFGKFEVVERKARVGINPSTKEKINIEASNTPRFKASKTLKDSIK